jgi:hypothetical protein
MPTKRKTYIIKENLGISDRVRCDDLTASLFQEFGVPEGAIHGELKEEDKLLLFVDQVGDKFGLDRKMPDLVIHVKLTNVGIHGLHRNCTYPTLGPRHYVSFKCLLSAGIAHSCH